MQDKLARFGLEIASYLWTGGEIAVFGDYSKDTVRSVTGRAERELKQIQRRRLWRVGQHRLGYAGCDSTIGGKLASFGAFGTQSGRLTNQYGGAILLSASNRHRL